MSIPDDSCRYRLQVFVFMINICRLDHKSEIPLMNPQLISPENLSVNLLATLPATLPHIFHYEPLSSEALFGYTFSRPTLSE